MFEAAEPFGPQPNWAKRAVAAQRQMRNWSSCFSPHSFVTVPPPGAIGLSAWLPLPTLAARLRGQLSPNRMPVCTAALHGPDRLEHRVRTRITGPIDKQQPLFAGPAWRPVQKAEDRPRHL